MISENDAAACITQQVTFLTLFHPWEVDEIESVYDYSYSILEIVYHDENKHFDQWKTYYMSQGLSFLHDIKKEMDSGPPISKRRDLPLQEYYTRYFFLKALLNLHLRHQPCCTWHNSGDYVQWWSDSLRLNMRNRA